MSGDYDKVFNSALSLKRSAVEEDGTRVKLADSLANLLFSIANEWEKDPAHFPKIILDKATQVAETWEEIVVGESIDEIMVDPTEA